MCGQAALLVLIFGEKAATEKFHFSLDAGLNLSYLTNRSAGGPLPGLHFGLGNHIKINDRWQFVPEFKPLNQRGVLNLPDPVKLTNLEGVEVQDHRLVANYLDIPLLFQYKLPNGIFFSAGPQFSYLLSARQISNVVITESNLEAELVRDASDVMNRFDYALPLEVGYAIRKAKQGDGIQLRLRYFYGFNKVFSETGLPESRFSTFQFILTFPFIKSDG